MTDTIPTKSGPLPVIALPEGTSEFVDTDGTYFVPARTLLSALHEGVLHGTMDLMLSIQNPEDKQSCIDGGHMLLNLAALTLDDIQEEILFGFAQNGFAAPAAEGHTEPSPDPED